MSRKVINIAVSIILVVGVIIGVASICLTFAHLLIIRNLARRLSAMSIVLFLNSSLRRLSWQLRRQSRSSSTILTPYSSSKEQQPHKDLNITNSCRLLFVEKNRYPSWFLAKDRHLLAKIDNSNLKPNWPNKDNWCNLVVALKNSNIQYVIYIKGRIYDEYITVNKQYTNTIMYGDGPRKTIVTSHKGVKNGGGITNLQTATSFAIGNGSLTNLWDSKTLLTKALQRQVQNHDLFGKAMKEILCNYYHGIHIGTYKVKYKETLYHVEYNNCGSSANLNGKVNWKGYHKIDKTTAMKFTI
ncbi:hypothetical protein CXB51_037011 [Gossypium anomalum]|uniref:Pectinesterase catalytic domain-containing protein n=1 Tax=Gossypium anomalum TaxID=47600 RepID=A0A8J6CJ40_9ROSI|nr:hypothetical protein CXB51_037011 [Gossypium anomalum]